MTAKRNISRKKNINNWKTRIPNQEELIADVLSILQGKYRGDQAFATQFVIDMKRIFPKAIMNKNLFLKAVKNLSRRNTLSVDNAWEYMRHHRDPSVDKVITSIPTGGKN